MEIPVFAWEESVIQTARTWPRSGWLFDLMHFVSNFSATIWVILAVLIYLGIRKGWKEIGTPLLLAIIAAGLGDLISRRIVKATVMRPRPEYLLKECDTSACWGLISSHATNVFAVMAVLYFFNKKNIYWALPMALLVSFSRVYLIDHYPLDVIGGAVVGMAIGTGVYVTYWKVKLSRTQSGEKVKGTT